MNDPLNGRRFPRVNVGEDHLVRFQVGDAPPSDLPMTNLSAGGCCIKVPSEHAAWAARGTRIDELYLIHPRIPNEPLSAEIRWLLGQAGKTSGFVLVGFSFLDPSPEVETALDRYVTELLGGNAGAGSPGTAPA